MFARSDKNKNPSHIADDVTDLLNEIEHVAGITTTAPFDESIVVTKQDAGVIVDGHIDDDDDALMASPTTVDRHPPDLSMQVSELSASLEELAFLEQSLKEDVPVATDKDKEIQDVPAKIHVETSAIDVKTDDELTAKTATAPGTSRDPVKEEEDSKMPVQEKNEPAADKSLMGKLWSSCWVAKGDAPIKNDKPTSTDTNTQDSPKYNEDVATTPVVKNVKAERNEPPTPAEDDGDFNPFVNIGNRLLDDDAAAAAHNAPQDDNDSYKQIMEITGKVLQGVLKVLGVASTVMMKLLGACARNVKVTGIVVLVIALGIYIKSFFSFSVTISIQPSAWNTSMMDDLTPPPPPVVEVDEIVVEDTQSTVQDWIAMLQVLALSMTIGLTGFSILGKTTSSNTTNGDAVTTYCKHEDDRSRYTNLNIKELKNTLHARGLNTTGNHSHLVDRLVAHDNGESAKAMATPIMDVDTAVVDRNTTVKSLQEELRTRKLPTTGLKEDLIAKVWIPARVQELQVLKMKELRALLEENKLSQHGKSRAELIRRLVEAGH